VALASEPEPPSLEVEASGAVVAPELESSPVHAPRRRAGEKITEAARYMSEG
jgi:hypothetical protein